MAHTTLQVRDGILADPGGAQGRTVQADDALLSAKLYPPPPRAGLVQRPRLTARLSAGLRVPLTLIVAPAGWGKTTLLTDWRAAPPEGRPTRGPPRKREP